MNTTTTPPDLSQPIANAQAVLAALAAGKMTAANARNAIVDALPDPSTCTAEEAAEILKPCAEKFTPEAQAEMLKLLMADRAAGEELLGQFRESGAVENQCTKEEAWKLAEEHHLHGAAARRITHLLMQDKAAGLRLIKGMPKLPPPPKVDLPPAPQHDPAAWDTPQDKASRARLAEGLIAEIKKEGRFTDYSSARNEARRRSPALFD